MTVYYELAPSRAPRGPARQARAGDGDGDRPRDPPATAVTVIVRFDGSPGVLRCRGRAAGVGRGPGDGKTTGVGREDHRHAGEEAVLVSRTMAVIVAESESSDGIVGVLVDSVSEPTATAGCAATTGTATGAADAPAVARDGDGANRGVARSAERCRDGAVCPGRRRARRDAPELEPNVDRDTGISALFESRTNAVIVAGLAAVIEDRSLAARDVTAKRSR